MTARLKAWFASSGWLLALAGATVAAALYTATLCGGR